MSRMAGFTVDRPRQCRARGHVWLREVVEDGQWVTVASSVCFRCGEPSDEALMEAAEGLVDNSQAH